MSQKSHALRRLFAGVGTALRKAANEPKTITCQAGMLDTAVPVPVGRPAHRYLQTGQLFGQETTARQFDRAAKLVADGRGGGSGGAPDGLLCHESGDRQTARIRRQLLMIFCAASGDAGQPDFHHAKERRTARSSSAPRNTFTTPHRGLSLARAAKAVNTEHILFLQDVQEGHRHQFHRLPFARPH